MLSLWLPPMPTASQVNSLPESERESGAGKITETEFSTIRTINDTLNAVVRSGGITRDAGRDALL